MRDRGCSGGQGWRALQQLEGKYDEHLRPLGRVYGLPVWPQLTFIPNPTLTPNPNLTRTPNPIASSPQSKKDQMIARARTAKTSQKVNDMLSGMTDTTSMDAFERMRTKVEMLESKAEVRGRGVRECGFSISDEGDANCAQT